MTGQTLDPCLFLKMVWALQTAHDTLTDPYLGEDDGERQEPAIKLLDLVLGELAADETAMALIDQAAAQTVAALLRAHDEAQGLIFDEEGRPCHTHLGPGVRCPLCGKQGWY